MTQIKEELKQSAKYIHYEAKSSAETKFLEFKEKYRKVLNSLSWEIRELVFKNGFEKYENISKDKELENPIFNYFYEKSISEIFYSMHVLPNLPKENAQSYSQPKASKLKLFYQNLEYFRHQEFNIGFIGGVIFTLSILALIKYW